MQDSARDHEDDLAPTGGGGNPGSPVRAPRREASVAGDSQYEYHGLCDVYLRDDGMMAERADREGGLDRQPTKQDMFEVDALVTLILPRCLPLFVHRTIPLISEPLCFVSSVLSFY